MINFDEVIESSLKQYENNYQEFKKEHYQEYIDTIRRDLSWAIIKGKNESVTLFDTNTANKTYLYTKRIIEEIRLDLDKCKTENILEIVAGEGPINNIGNQCFYIKIKLNNIVFIL